MATISVIGAGYVGLVTAACFAHIGHSVRCVETDPGRLSRLESGILPLKEPGLDALVEEATATGKLIFCGGVADSLPGADFTFLAVPTPSLPGGDSDLSAIFSVCDVLKENASEGQCVVVKSTVPVGTCDSVDEYLGHRHPVVSNPEFLREGTAVDDFLEPDRLVVGSSDRAHADAVAQLYSSLDAPVYCTDRRSAELAKYASNAYLAVRLSYINELSRLSAATGADIDSVTRIMAADHRIGSHYLKSGIGWGGSCLPKDVSALLHTGEAAGTEPFMLRAAISSNTAQVELLLSRMSQLLDGLGGREITMLGAAFKAGTDDVRESPAIAAARRIHSTGARVRVHDPLAVQNALQIAPELVPVEDVQDALRGADAVVLATDWPEYTEINWEESARLMRGDLVYDARNVLNPSMVTGAGLRYASYGRRDETADA